jgi:ElaB/YqjD/DUF883 family membrane-anchored ribosome-binding protein
MKASIRDRLETVARNAGNSVADHLHRDTEPALHEWAEQAGDMARQGMRRVHEGSDRMRQRASRASDFAADYLRYRPVRSVLMATAAAGLLYAAVRFFSKR